MIQKKNPFKRWEVSIMEMHDGEKIQYKVTRRVLLSSEAETMIFDSKLDAIEQFEKWME